MKTLFENDLMKIFMNSSDEVFILNKNTKAELRIGINFENTLITFQPAIVLPTRVNGLPAFIFLGK